MRIRLGLVLFALSVIVAACGGGGGGTSNVLPAQPGSHQPLKTGQAIVSMRIPPQPKLSSSAKRPPAYVSPATKSVVITVTSPSNPTQTFPPQIFAIATPTPCTQNQDGSYVCTFNVNVAYGSDDLSVATYSVANPGPNDIPLSTFTATISVQPGSTPAPIAVTASGNVASVSISLVSPDPYYTSAPTQVVPAGAPFAALPLIVTPMDASGASILTDTFTTPISVSVSPSNAGVQLQIVKSACTPAASSAPAATVTLTCAADLPNVRYLYNGSLSYDSSNNVVDIATITASPQPATPSTVSVRLASNIISYPLPASSAGPNFIINQPDSDGTFTYLLAGNATGTYMGSIGRFDPANPLSATQADFAFTGQAMTVASNGDIWVAEGYNTSVQQQYSLACFHGISSTPAAVVNLPFSSGAVNANALGTDNQGNIWYAGSYNQAAGVNVVGFIPAAQSSCASAPSTSTAMAQVSGKSVEYASDLAPLPSGVAVATNLSIYNLTTASSGVVSPTVTAPPSMSNSEIRSDGVGNLLIGMFNQSTTWGAIGVVPSGSTSVTTLNAPNGAYADSIAGFPAAAFSRLAIADSGTGYIGIGDLNPLAPTLVPSGFKCFGTFFDAHGDAWGQCSNASGNTMNHVIRTTTWSLIAPPALYSNSIMASTTQALAMLERTSAGAPFSVTADSLSGITPNGDSTWSPFTNNIELSVGTSITGKATITVSDKSGRTQQVSVPVVTPTPCGNCGFRSHQGHGPHGRP